MIMQGGVGRTVNPMNRLKIIKATTKPKRSATNLKNENGLQNLVAYYQDLFKREENLKHYSPDDYQNAKRNFVKYSLSTRNI